MGLTVVGQRPSWWKRRQAGKAQRHEQEAGRSRGVHTQEAKNKQEVGPGSKAPKATPGDPRLSARPHLTKVSQASQTVHANGWQPSVQIHEGQCQAFSAFLNLTV